MKTATAPQVLSDKQQEIHDFYHENGYYVLPAALSAEEVQALRDETVKICSGELGAVGGSVAPAEGETADDIIKRFLCIHFPHKISDLMYDVLSHPKIVEVLTAAISPNVKCMQSMLFIKAAGKPGQAWHQDEDYIPTRDRSLCGAWIAMDDATIENGCLWIIPGSHKSGVLWEQQWHGDSRFDCAFESYDFPYKDEDAIPVEVKAGTVVFFNGYTLHRSLPNVAKSGYRRALVNHYMSAESLLPWFHSNSTKGHPVATLDHRDIVMVAGTDPYAYKGVESIHHAFVRTDGKSGCLTGSGEEMPYEK